MADRRRENPVIKIRCAGASDNVLLAELGTETFDDSFGADNTPENMAAYLATSFSPEKQAAELAQPGSLFLIAELDGTPVGYARILEGHAPPVVTGRAPVEIVRIYARRGWIGYGVGSRLIQACLSEARRRGCDTAWLGVWERNERAIAFYRRWGFTPVGTQNFQLGGDPQTDLIMQRPVQGPEGLIA